MQDRIPARVVWALGVTQIIGYGTLYYSFSVLAPAIGQEFDWSSEWVYGALTVALLAGGFLAPFAGHLADRFGAARVMSLGSVAAAVTLLAAAASLDGVTFAVALLAMELASSFVLYSTAFTLLAQLSSQGAQRRITHLTLIAGFASTIFWPGTSLLLDHIDWRGVYMVFGALNLLVCAPLHLWLSRTPQSRGALNIDRPTPVAAATSTLHGHHRRAGFALMLVGFGIQGFILSAILMQIVPLLAGLGLQDDLILVTSLFGPAQVLSRLTNMVLGRNLVPGHLAIIAALLPPLGMALLVWTAPSQIGSVLFAVLFGLGSGLTSIVAGALPLHLLGPEKYGSRMGWLSSARQIASAVAPFCLAVTMGALGISGALLVMTLLGGLATLIFATLALLPRGTVIRPIGTAAA